MYIFWTKAVLVLFLFILVSVPTHAKPGFVVIISSPWGSFIKLVVVTLGPLSLNNGPLHYRTPFAATAAPSLLFDL